MCGFEITPISYTKWRLRIHSTSYYFVSLEWQGFCDSILKFILLHIIHFVFLIWVCAVTTGWNYLWCNNALFPDPGVQIITEITPNLHVRWTLVQSSSSVESESWMPLIHQFLFILVNMNNTNSMKLVHFYWRTRVIHFPVSHNSLQG